MRGTPVGLQSLGRQAPLLFEGEEQVRDLALSVGDTASR